MSQLFSIFAIAMACLLSGSTAELLKGDPSRQLSLPMDQNLIGFLAGFSPPSGDPQALPSAGEEKLLRLGQFCWKIPTNTIYEYVVSFAPTTITHFVIFDVPYNFNPYPYPWNVGGVETGEFDDWAQFSQILNNSISFSIQTDNGVNYWDVWNEPQFIHYGPEDQPRILETLKRGYLGIHRFPGQRMIAPTTVGFSSVLMETIADFSVTNEMVFDAWSWHEFNRPEEIPLHVQEMHSILAARPGLLSPTPKIIIDEYANQEQHLIPGFAVGFFYYMELAGVDYASRACWSGYFTSDDSQSDCWKGVNGMFLEDNQTPQALYWTFLRYAQLRSLPLRFQITSSDPNGTVAMGGIDYETGTLRLLLGRFVNQWGNLPAQPVPVTIKMGPFLPSFFPVNPLQIELISDSRSIGSLYGSASALIQPILIPSDEYEVNVDEATKIVSITLPSCADGAAISVVISPSIPIFTSSASQLSFGLF